MSAVLAFLVRDLRVAWSYRLSFIFGLGSLVFSVVSLKFVAQLVNDGAPADLAPYGGDYFTFAIIGAAINLAAFPALRTFASSVRDAQVNGTFEAMLATRTRGTSIVVASAAYQLALLLIELVLLFVVATVALGAELRPANLGPGLGALVLTIVAFAGMGLLSCAFTILFRQQEPLSGAMLAGSFLLSGILYPTSVLPSWLEPFSLLLPMTHAVELTRGLLVEGADTAVAGHALALGAFALSLPLGLWAVAAALRSARRSGSLAHY